jgi:hypothetical protein
MSIYDGRFFFLFAQHMSEGGMSTTIFNDQMKNKINKAVGTMDFRRKRQNRYP